MAGAFREAVIHFEFFRGRQTETVVKVLCVDKDTASETFRFKGPYMSVDNGSSENGIHWADGHMENKELYSLVTVALAGFAHLYV